MRLRCVAVLTVAFLAFASGEDWDLCGDLTLEFCHLGKASSDPLRDGGCFNSSLVSGNLTAQQNVTTDQFVWCNAASSGEQWGVDQIKRLQESRKESLDLFFELVSFAGNGVVYGLMIAFYVLWVDKEVGLHMVGIMSFTSWVNFIAKMSAVYPRPYWVSNEVVAVECRGSTFSLPSGHVMSSVAVLGWYCLYVTARHWPSNRTAHSFGFNTYKKEHVNVEDLPYALPLSVRRCAIVCLWLACIGWVTTMSMARMFTAAHFPQDVFIGAFVGMCVLFFWWFVVQRLLLPYVLTGGRFSWKDRSVLALVASLAMAITGAVVYYVVVEPYEVSHKWRYIAGLQCTEPLSPGETSLKQVLQVSGSLGGVMVSCAILYEFFDFDPARLPTSHSRFRMRSYIKRYLLRIVGLILPGGIVFVVLTVLTTLAEDASVDLSAVLGFLTTLISIPCIVVGDIALMHYNTRRFHKSDDWKGRWLTDWVLPPDSFYGLPMSDSARLYQMTHPNEIHPRSRPAPRLRQRTNADAAVEMHQEDNNDNGSDRGRKRSNAGGTSPPGSPAVAIAPALELDLDLQLHSDSRSHAVSLSHYSAAGQLDNGGPR